MAGHWTWPEGQLVVVPPVLLGHAGLLSAAHISYDFPDVSVQLIFFMPEPHIIGQFGCAVVGM